MLQAAQGAAAHRRAGRMAGRWCWPGHHRGARRPVLLLA